jgi:hypothetical protein
MNTIGTAGYERQPDIRQAPPATAPFDHGGDRGGDRGGNRNGGHNKDHDGERANDVRDSGIAPTRGVARAWHKLNVTV